MGEVCLPLTREFCPLPIYRLLRGLEQLIMVNLFPYYVLVDLK
ncbi:hypothetical protein GXM_02134 [Nostoc sphaeroides CCNUC1]|uniref:Uncharacterized protein n=1 Tax=Nostoc sphaeroides CCNUC1 TaxID=2653204 RepID=A0A5P8VXM9_9NOSO|nr:hypothetical protein GXM_02134 [Nostoc sphaeroides CCNUC1]